MKRFADGLKMLVALSLLFAFAAAMAPQASAATGGWVTIHKANCDKSVTGNIFDNCHGNVVKGVSFTIGGTTKSTNSKGVVKVAVAAGAVTIIENDFATLATAGKAYVYCSIQHAGTPVLLARNTTVGKVTVNVNVGNNVICDWYDRTVPPPPPVVPATITVHKSVCAASVTGDIFANCHANVVKNVWFDVAGVDKHTTSKGTVKFTGIVPGAVTITETDFGTLATAGKAYVYCSVQPGGSPVLYAQDTTTGVVTITVDNGANVTCDWYDRTT